MTDPIPTVNTWQTNPALAESEDAALVQQALADAAITGDAIALGIAAKIATVAAPIAAAAVSATPAGPAVGALVAAGLTALGTTLANQHTNALSALTPIQQATITQAVSVGAAIATSKLTPGVTP